LLKVLKDAMLYFSRQDTSIANVIPSMDHINDCLMTAAINLELPLSIRTAAGLAKKTLNCYYSHTDESETYHIAMILHSQYKLQYFKNTGWQPEWITTAKELLCTQFELHYRDFDEVDSGSTEIPAHVVCEFLIDNMMLIDELL
ncbi:hypothetical protein BDQ17DRAFT_1254536, partial [Cyathus striatus]